MRCSTKCAVLFLAVVLSGGVAPTWAQDSDPLAYVTIMEGGRATRGANGAPFESEPGMFSDKGNGLFSGDSIVTTSDGTAVVSLPACGAVVYVAPSSELRVDALPVVDKSIPTALTLLDGRAYVTTRRSLDRWVVIAGSAANGRGYTMSKGASLSVDAGPDGVTFAVATGAATYFEGDVPEGSPVSESGELTGENGLDVAAGQRITTGGQVEAITEKVDEWSYGAQRERASSAVYRFGLDNGTRWVEAAESGDFTPVRLAEGATALPFGGGELEAEFRFDQPRSTVVSPAPRAQSRVVTAGVSSPVRALLESRRPTSVVVGQRLARTRIIGSPGTQGGPIRVNPNAEVLIRLPR